MTKNEQKLVLALLGGGNLSDWATNFLESLSNEQWQTHKVLGDTQLNKLYELAKKGSLIE